MQFVRSQAPAPIVIYTLQVTRHTRREAGIQRQGWQSQIRPCSLDSGNPCRNDGLRDTYV